MPATVRARAAGSQNTDATTHAITLPAGIVNGELLLVGLSQDTATAEIISLTNDWQVLSRVPQGTSNNHTGYVLWKRANGADSLSVTFDDVTANAATPPGNEQSTHISIAVTDAGDPQVASLGAGAGTSSPQTVTMPSLSPSGGAGDYLAIIFVHTDSNTTQAQVVTPPSGFGNLQSRNPTTAQSAAVFSMEQTYAGVSSIAPGTASLSVFEQVVTHLVVIPHAPPAGGTGGPARVRSVSTDAQDSAPTATPLKPAGLAVDDYMLAFHLSDADGSLASMTAPTGWLELASSAGDSNALAEAKIWGKFATSADVAATSFAFPDSSGAQCAVGIAVLEKGTFDPADVFAVDIIFSSSATATATHPAPSVAGVTDGLLLTMHAADTGGTSRTYTVPTGMTLTLFENIEYVALQVTQLALTADGATGVKNATLSGSAPYKTASMVIKPAPVTTKTYYVSAAGADTAAGTQAAPWATVAKVNSTVLNPGDTVLFRGGDTFSGTLLYLQYAGTASDPITIGSYGTGRATLTNATNYGIYAYNVGGIVVKDLMITGDTGAAAAGYDGIAFYKDTAGRASYIRVNNVESSGWGKGLSIGGANGGGFADVDVVNCDLHDNRDVGFISYGPTFVPGSPAYAHTDVTVSNVRAYDNLGNSANTTGNSGSGIVVSSVDIGLVELCAAYGNGSLNAATGEGPVGIWAYAARAVVIERSVSYSNSSGTNADGGGFDLDLHTVNCTIQYCLAYANRGYGILLFATVGTTGTTGNVIRYNLCYGNARNVNTAFGELSIYGPVQNTQVYHNTFIARDTTGAKPVGASISGAAPAGVTLRNNIFVTQTGLVLYSELALTTAELLAQGNAWWTTDAAPYWWWGSTSYASLAAWRAVATGQEQVSGGNVGYVGNPLLVNGTASPTVTDPAVITGAAGLALQAASPIARVGLDLPALFSTQIGARDYFGNAPTAPYTVGGAELDVTLTKTGGGVARATGVGVPATTTSEWRYPTTATPLSGQWDNQSGAVGSQVGDAATWTSTAAGTAVLELSGFALHAAVPANAILHSVKLRIRTAVDSALVETLTAQCYVGTTPIGSPAALVRDPVSHEDTVTVSGVKYSDLANLRIRITATRATGSPGFGSTPFGSTPFGS